MHRPTIGERIRELRGSQTQMELATAAGVSVQLVRALEQGQRQTASIASLQALARALDVDMSELLAGPRALAQDPGDEASVVRIRHALTGVEDLLPAAAQDGEPADLVSAQRALTYAWGSYWAGRYGQLAQLLPETLVLARAVHRQVATAERDQAAALAAGVHQVAACTLVHLAENDAAHYALRSAISYADAGSDPLQSATLRGSVSWVLLAQGRYDEAHRLAAAAAASIEPVVGDVTPEHLSVYGSLLLSAATAAGRAGATGSARDLLAPAADVAGRLPGDRNDYETAFGPSQVVMQTTDVLVVSDEYDQALAAARAMPRDTGLPLAARARHLADLALAHSQLGSWEAATDVLLTAERAAPDWMRHQRLPRQVMRDMLARWGRPPLRLREMAARLGVA